MIKTFGLYETLQHTNHCTLYKLSIFTTQICSIEPMAQIMSPLGQMNAVTLVLDVLIRPYKIIVDKYFALWVNRLLKKHTFGYIYEKRTKKLNAVI